jgi:threonine synthase
VAAASTLHSGSDAARTQSGVVGWRCAVCSAFVDIAEPLTFACPNATVTDPYHALRIVQHDEPVRSVSDDPNPFISYRPHFAWDSFAAAHGLSTEERIELVRSLDDAVSAVAGTGFVVTPFARANALSSVLGFTDDGGVWIKDETRQVGGSHKSRHLFSAMLHLLVTEQTGSATWTAADRPPLAIASCGNAALAASTLAAAVHWPIDVFVPPSADRQVVVRLEMLGATVNRCPRLETDPGGDPCVHRFREAIRRGAIPFSVQGPENAWCLDGGRTIGWEMSTARPDHLFVQVGGGALARCTVGALAQTGPLPKFHAVQTEACAPLARAWKRANAGDGGVAAAASHWRDYMTPWENVGTSAADGILDDETYDWIGVVSGIHASHGAPVIAKESEILAANDLARRHTDILVSHTGSAGLAGLLAIRDVISNHERVGVIFSGVQR